MSTSNPEADNENLRNLPGANGESADIPDSENGNLEPLENQGLQEPDFDEPAPGRKYTFEKSNSVTIKVTDGRGSIAWKGYRSGGRVTTRAVAWIIGVGAGYWVCRYRDKASRPMKLPAARKYVIELIKGIRPGRKVTDPVKQLNQWTLDAIDPMPTFAAVVAIERGIFGPKRGQE